MRLILTVTALLVTFGLGSAVAQQTEQDILNRYLKQAEGKHTTKMGWASFNFSVDRINRNNDYNQFAHDESLNISDGNLDWLSQGYSFGAEFGMVLRDRILWSVGGEYWLRLGDEIAGNSLYLPTGNTVEDLSSEIRIYGFTTGLQYYLMGKPNPVKKLRSLAVRAGGTLGYYFADWDLWSDFQNLNLSTATPAEGNTTFKGKAPGFSFGIGADYPIGLWDMALGVDMSYLYLNFTNIAWYNSEDEEIIVSYDGTSDGRVDLNMSGPRGKVEIKRYFSW